MKKVLFLTSGYCGKSTANGLCTKALANELMKHDTEVFVISCETDKNAPLPTSHIIPITYQPKTSALPQNTILRKLFVAARMLTHIFSPSYDKDLVKRTVSSAKEICSTHKINAVVSMYFPLTAIVAGYELRKIYPQIKHFIYELDSVADGIGGKRKWSNYLNLSYKLFLNSLYKKSDIIMVLKCHEKHWLSDHAKYAFKMEVVDLPLLDFSKSPSVQTKSSDTVSFIYAGILDYSYRSPEIIYKTFKEIGKRINWKFDFYSKGCDELLLKAKYEMPSFETHGYVEQQILNQAIFKADVLVSIGNTVSNSLPSKIITYMTYKKPIIHFSLKEDDVCVEYLNKYPLALIIRCTDNDSLNADKIVNFVVSMSGNSISNEEIQQVFPMNIPSYSAKIILKNIN